jgi:quinol monooxygenase YgiN
MYGTIARMRVKPGGLEALKQLAEADSTMPPGMVTQYVYLMDADPNELYLAVVFESKEAYVANAQSPEQHAMYEKIRAWLETDPEWHDGEIVAHS